MHNIHLYEFYILEWFIGHLLIERLRIHVLFSLAGWVSQQSQSGAGVPEDSQRAADLLCWNCEEVGSNPNEGVSQQGGQ